MTIFASILLILAVAVLFTRLASALSAPYPSFLALGGAVLALLPGAPSVQLDPSLALAIFVAPVLFMAAFETSLRDLHDYRLSIITLVAIAVGVTTAAVAVVFHALVPGVPWAAAVALGAIVVAAGRRRRDRRFKAHKNPPAVWSPSSKAKACSTTRRRC